MNYIFEAVSMAWDACTPPLCCRFGISSTSIWEDVFLETRSLSHFTRKSSKFAIGAPFGCGLLHFSNVQHGNCNVLNCLVKFSAFLCLCLCSKLLVFYLYQLYWNSVYRRLKCNKIIFYLSMFQNIPYSIRIFNYVWYVSVDIYICLLSSISL